jgi:dTDP-glucose 4,6-dehydratase
MKYKNYLLITGGAGFIGSAFLRNLVPKYSDWFFVNLDKLTYAGNLEKVESIANFSNYMFILGDICDSKLVGKIFEEYGINWVINFAAESHVDNSIINSTSFIQTNIAGTNTLLDLAKSYWKLDGLSQPNERYRFIQISTDEVYGSLGLKEKSWDEKDPISPNSPYSASKASAELICRSYFVTHLMPVIITRSSNNYGPYQNREKFIPTVIYSALHDSPIPIYGNGENIRDWIYVVDNVIFIEKILLNGSPGEIYNIGGNNEHSNIELVLNILKLIPDSKSNIMFVPDRLGHDFRYSIDTSKLTGLLGKLDYHDFFDTLKITIDSIKKGFTI